MAGGFGILTGPTRLRRPRRIYEYVARVRPIEMAGAATVSRSVSYVATPTLLEVFGAAAVSVSYTIPAQTVVVALDSRSAYGHVASWEAVPSRALHLTGRSGVSHSASYTCTPRLMELASDTRTVAAVNLSQRHKEDADLFGDTDL